MDIEKTCAPVAGSGFGHVGLLQVGQLGGGLRRCKSPMSKEASLECS